MSSDGSSDGSSVNPLPNSTLITSTATTRKFCASIHVNTRLHTLTPFTVYYTYYYNQSLHT